MPEILVAREDSPPPPQDTVIDRRAFLARLAAVTAVTSAVAIARPRLARAASVPPELYDPNAFATTSRPGS